MEWISVKDKNNPPPELERVLISCEEGVCSGTWTYEQWQIDPIGSYAGDGCVFHVTHWMSLPELPKSD